MKKLLGILLLAGATALTGCGDSEDFVFINNNTGVIQAPVCADDAYATNSNAPLTVAAANGVLTNDTPNGATLTFAGTSANGGTIVGAQDGSFTYTPATNFAGTDTFTYTLGNSGGVVTCTVTVTVTAVNGFFVDATNGNDATGSFTNGQPFATIQAAVTAAAVGNDIIVRPGNYTGAITLQNNQRLLGSGSVLAQGAVNRPVLTGPVVMADGNTLDFLRIEGTNGDAVDGNGQNGGTVTNCEFVDILRPAVNTGSGVNAETFEGTWVISNNTFTNVGGIGVELQATATNNVTVTISNNTFTNGDFTSIGLVSGGTSTVAASITGNQITNDIVINGALEIIVGDNSNFCLNLENNTNDDQYSLTAVAGPSVLNVEQLTDLTVAQPAGAGNIGTVDITTGAGSEPPIDVADGTCGF